MCKISLFNIQCSSNGHGHDIAYQKAESCRTINVYPQPDAKKEKRSKDANFESSELEQKIEEDVPTADTDKNPNVFVLKIKRSGHDGDKRHDLEVEFKTPRPWRKRDWLK